MAINFENRYTDVVSTGDELRLSDYLGAVMASWRIIATVTLVVVLLGTAYAFLAPPVYRADAMIQVTESQPGANNAPNANAVQTVSQMFDAKSTTAAEIELLRSRLVVEDTVNKLHLDIAARPRYFPFIGGLISDVLGTRNGVAPVSWLSGFEWGSASIAVPKFDTPKEAYEKTYILTSGGPFNTTRVTLHYMYETAFTQSDAGTIR